MADLDVVGVAIVLLVAVTLTGYWSWRLARHRKSLGQLAVRVHVNGIRGKSTVTRLVAGVMREGGFVTVAKTTGSAARVILPTGEELPIERPGAPTINEQIDVVGRYVDPGVEAPVIECMAVSPTYQQYAQD